MTAKTQMRALTLWQPWASAMDMGVKRNETRGRLTHVRGDVLICSAMKRPSLAECGGNKDLHYYGQSAKHIGVALCMVEIYDCVPTQHFMKHADKAMLPLRTITELELFWGNYDTGRFAWLTRNLRSLPRKIPVKGHQGFFFVPDAVAAAVHIQLKS